MKRIKWIQDEEAQAEIEREFAASWEALEMPEYLQKLEDLKDPRSRELRRRWHEGFREGFEAGAREMRKTILRRLQAPDRQKGAREASKARSRRVDDVVLKFNEWRRYTECVLDDTKAAQAFFADDNDERLDWEASGTLEQKRMVDRLLKAVRRKKAKTARR